MKLSVFTTVSDPILRGDLWPEAIRNYGDLANEVVVVDGSLAGQHPPTFISNYRYIYNAWPPEFKWGFIGEQFQRGYEECTGDWVIHADLDFIFHEDDFSKIRQAIKENPHAPALSFYKRQFIQPDRFNLKSRLVVAVNKGEYKDRIRFDGGGDLCQPTLDGQELKQEHVPEARIPIWNYECILKTKEQLMEDKGRFARAWEEEFGAYKLGGPDNESAYDKWLEMVLGRNSKSGKTMSLSEHPRVMRERLKSLTPKMWGYSGFNNYERCKYVEGA